MNPAGPSSQSSSTSRFAPTEFAKKYGVSKQKKWKKEGKSGFTPLSPFPSPSVKRLNRTEEEHAKSLETYQRNYLQGFTARELEDVGCINEPLAKRATVSLGAPIHDIYQKDKWLVRKSDPKIGGDLDLGLWQAKNPVVWAALQPSLRLASQFLSNKTLAPWFDALTCGPRVRIRPRRPGYARQYLFRRRHIKTINDEMHSIVTKYKGIEYLSTNPRIARKIRFCFFEDDSACNGVTSSLSSVSGSLPPWVRCKINVRLFKPLLRNDLTNSERLVQQFIAAKVILHETAHALRHLAHAYTIRCTNSNEPFFEGELIAEVGYSMENALFGGHMYSLVPGTRKYKVTMPNTISKKGIPSMGLMLDAYPNFRKAESLKDALKKRREEQPTSPERNMKTHFYSDTDFDDDPSRGIKMSVVIWPVPIRYIENYQQADFWKSITKFGGNQIKVPQTLGRRRYRIKSDPGEIVIGNLYEAYGGIPPVGDFGHEPWNTKSPLRRLSSDVDTLKKYAIRIALRNQTDWKQMQGWDDMPKHFTKFPIPEVRDPDYTAPKRDETPSPSPTVPSWQPHTSPNGVGGNSNGRESAGIPSSAVVTSQPGSSSPARNSSSENERAASLHTVPSSPPIPVDDETVEYTSVQTPNNNRTRDDENNDNQATSTKKQNTGTQNTSSPVRNDPVQASPLISRSTTRSRPSPAGGIQSTLAATPSQTQAGNTTSPPVSQGKGISGSQEHPPSSSEFVRSPHTPVKPRISSPLGFLSEYETSDSEAESSSEEGSPSQSAKSQSSGRASRSQAQSSQSPQGKTSSSGGSPSQSQPTSSSPAGTSASRVGSGSSQTQESSNSPKNTTLPKGQAPSNPSSSSKKRTTEENTDDSLGSPKKKLNPPNN